MSQKIPRFLFELYCLLRSDIKVQGELLRNVLINGGIRPQDVVSFERGGLFRVCVYFDDRVKAEKLQRRINPHLGACARFHVKKIKNENWKTKFAKNFSTFALTKCFDVVPSWKLRQYKKTRRAPIILESINAFGTGLHETTSFMAQLIEQLKGKFSTFLDIGTGTGLLAMIALKCGAKEIRAVDIDKDAVVAAKQNFKINGYSDRNIIAADIEKYKVRRKFDFVAANLITRDLLKYKRKIISLIVKNGFLAISGILEENYPEIQKAFRLKRLKCIKVKKGEQWVAVLYKRIS